MSFLTFKKNLTREKTECKKTEEKKDFKSDFF